MPQNIGSQRDDLISCGNCALGEVCLPLALESADVERLDDIVGRSKPLQKGQFLFRQGDDFNSIYAVRAGSIKSYSISCDGIEQVLGFYFPGEIAGMDGIGRNRHTSSAVALETSSVCQIPFSRLGDLSREIPSLQNRCFQLISQEMVDDRVLMSLLNRTQADARVAAFFLSISERKARRKLSAVQFRLPMSRCELASYLGLTIETISRVLTKFQKLEILFVENKEITVRDMPALKKKACS